jgi:hypothetical protein
MNDVSSLGYVVEWAEILKSKNITSDNTLFIVLGNKLDMLGTCSAQTPASLCVACIISAAERTQESILVLSGLLHSKRRVAKTESFQLGDQTLNQKVASKELDNVDDLGVASWNALERKAISDKAQQITASIGGHYLETSAKTGQNIKKLFKLIAEQSVLKFKIQPKFRGSNEDEHKLKKKKRGADDKEMTNCQCVIV